MALRACLKKFGIGKWVQIVDSGVLPGKQIQQLNGQTQRLLGKQSLAEYTGMRLDIDRIRMDNDALTDVTRKNGLITNQGGIRSKETLNVLREENLKCNRTSLASPLNLNVEEVKGSNRKENYLHTNAITRESY